MVDQLKGIGGSGGSLSGTPGRARRQLPKEAPSTAIGECSDMAQLRVDSTQTVRALAGELESLQRSLASLPEGEARGVLRERLAKAEVTMANLLGVGAEAPVEGATRDLARVLTQLGKAGELPRERVLGLLREEESSEERRTP